MATGKEAVSGPLLQRAPVQVHSGDRKPQFYAETLYLARTWAGGRQRWQCARAKGRIASTRHSPTATSAGAVAPSQCPSVSDSHQSVPLSGRRAVVLSLLLWVYQLLRDEHSSCARRPAFKPEPLLVGRGQQRRPAPGSVTPPHPPRTRGPPTRTGGNSMLQTLSPAARS